MGLLNSGKLIVGYDLGNEFSQISYSLSDSGFPTREGNVRA